MRHKGYQAEATKCSLTFILRQGFTLILRLHFRADLRGPGNENNIKEPLINVCEAVSARQKSAKKRSL